MPKQTIDIIVPCYNEEHNILAFYGEMRQVVEEIKAGSFKGEYSFRYIFIDDGSSDDTLSRIKEIAEEHAKEHNEACSESDTSEVKYISFSRNFGKEAAMYAGLKASCRERSDMAVIIDADLQHPPKLLIEMISKMEETGCDSVAARRVTRKGEPRLRSLFARAFYRIMNRYCDIDIIDGMVDYRLMKRNMVKAIVDMPETQRFSKGIFAWVGFDTRWVEFENIKRFSGESKWSVWKLTKYAVDGFLDFADSPLKFIGAFGGIISAGSALYLIGEILKTLIVGKDTPGYSSTICLILFFGGIIIAILGIIGEYIGRMYMETKGRPIYVEKESNIDSKN